MKRGELEKKTEEISEKKTIRKERPKKNSKEIEIKEEEKRKKDDEVEEKKKKKTTMMKSNKNLWKEQRKKKGKNKFHWKSRKELGDYFE